MNKGVWTKEQIKFLAKILDDLKKWNNFFMETFDGKIYEGFLYFINNLALDKIPEKYKLPLSELTTTVMEGNWDEFDDKAAVILAELLDIPGMNEDQEVVLFSTGVQFIVEAIKLWIEKKRSTDERKV